MSRLIRDTDIIRKLNNLIEAIGAEPKNARYDKAGLLKIVNAIIVAVEGIDEAYSVEAVVRELEAKSTSFAHKAEYEKDIGYAYVATRKYGISDGLDIAIEIVRGGRNE